MLHQEKPLNTEMITTDTRKEVQEVEEVAAAEEAAFKVAEVVQDLKLPTQIVMIDPMANVNLNTKRNQLKVKRTRKLREMKRRSKEVIEEVKTEMK